MRRTLSFVVLISLLFASNSWARVWYVKPDSTGAVINIQAGIDSCAAGDTVVAMPGVYSGDGNWDLDFKGKPIVVMSASRHDPAITDSTVIDGGSQHRGFYFHSRETNASILEGFIITDGSYHPCEGWCYAGPGGGVACDSASSPMIRYNKIDNCSAGFYSYGGGIYCSGSSAPIISNNEICANRGYEGAGICCFSSSPVIIENRIHDNSIINPDYYGYAAGIFCGACPSATISNNKIYHNGATGTGGVRIEYSSATIRGNEIWGNREEPGYGASALEVSSSTVIVVSNSIHDNISCGSAVTFESSCATIDSNYIHGNGYPFDSQVSSYGIAIANSKAIIRCNDISSNTTGGIDYYGDSTGTIENNNIADNGHVRPCGGIQCSSRVDIVGNTIKNNVSFYGGGGITCHASASIRNNVIVSNSCHSHEGGGIFCDGPSPSIINNTIVGNVAGRGSGICIGAQSHPILNCNTISDNRLYECEDCDYRDGGGIYSESGLVAISCCDVFNNGGGNYGGMPDESGVNGNFSADPIFCDTSSGIYTLHVASPCLPGNHPNGSSCGLIGALGQGCNYVATLLQEYHAEIDVPAIVVTWKLADFGKHMDFSVLRAEIPSAEYQEIPGAAITREGLTFSFKDMDCKPGATYRYRVDVSDEAGRRPLFVTEAVSLPALPLTLYQNYPNPFNPSTEIKYYLPEKSQVTLDVYDISGKRIAQLVRKEQEKGFNTVKWNGLDGRGVSVASGIYFYRLTAAKKTISKKMVLLR